MSLFLLNDFPYVSQNVKIMPIAHFSPLSLKVCFLCGHGGHLQCLMEWFSEQTVCPTGCGCSCKFDTNLG